MHTQPIHTPPTTTVVVEGSAAAASVRRCGAFMQLRHQAACFNTWQLVWSGRQHTVKAVQQACPEAAAALTPSTLVQRGHGRFIPFPLITS